MKITNPNALRVLIILSLALGFLFGRRVGHAKVPAAK